MIEVWKNVKGFESCYSVSNFGNIKSKDRYIEHAGKFGGNKFHKGKKLNPRTDKNGYKTVILYDSGKSKTFKVHRIVALAFIENPDNKEQVNHKDEDKSNNSANNLEWITCKENINYGTGIARRAYKRSKAYRLEVDVEEIN